MCCRKRWGRWLVQGTWIGQVVMAVSCCCEGGVSHAVETYGANSRAGCGERDGLQPLREVLEKRGVLCRDLVK